MEMRDQTVGPEALHRQVGTEPLAERHAFDQLRDDERAAVQLAEVVNDDDVRMVETRSRLRFLPEPPQSISVGREILRDEFDGHTAIEFLVVRRVDDSHASPA